MVFLMKKIDDDLLTRLIEAALAARAQSYSPYSGYPVGAAILADDGNIYSGCNVENAAYPLGFCAEANAIGNMAVAGGRRIEIAVIAGPNDEICAPCGGCRQQLREFVGADDMPILICDVDGKIILETSLFEMLPNSFGPDTVNAVRDTGGSV